MDGQSTIELRGLTKGFPEGAGLRAVLSRVDASWNIGERVVLLGRSGSGKSTLLHLLAGLDRPDAGEVVVAGTRVSALDEEGRTRFRRQSVGLIFQSFNLIPTLSALENVRLPLDLLGHGARESQAAAETLLERVGLADRARTYPDRLSGGEQQRIAVARALVHAPELILADEPTGNLDADSGRRVMTLLNELACDTGKTLVLVTHDRSLTAGADRVLTLEGGRLA